MANETVPKVFRLDFTEPELIFVALMLQSVQAKLQMNVRDMVSIAISISKVAEDHFEILQSLGKKLDLVTTQEEYDRILTSLVFKQCPDCGEHHA